MYTKEEQGHSHYATRVLVVDDGTSFIIGIFRVATLIVPVYLLPDERCQPMNIEDQPYGACLDDPTRVCSHDYLPFNP